MLRCWVWSLVGALVCEWAVPAQAADCGSGDFPLDLAGTTTLQIALAWQPVSGAVGYVLERDDDSAFSSPEQYTLSAATTGYGDTGKQPDDRKRFDANTCIGGSLAGRRCRRDADCPSGTCPGLEAGQTHYYRVRAPLSGGGELLSDCESAVLADAPVRGVAGDLWADVVLGQPDFGTNQIRKTTATAAQYPGGVFVDRSVQPNRVLISDTNHNRILGFDSLGTCDGSGPNCTADADCAAGQSCEIDSNLTPSVVLGQFAAVDQSACNGDGTGQLHPDRADAAADTLCLIHPEQISIAETITGSVIARSPSGSYLVPDILNHRVLEYDDPFASDAVADAVLGQADFAANQCNRGATQPSCDSLCLHGSLAPITGVTFDDTGNLWVADPSNARVLRFPSSGGSIATTADVVLGQNDCQSNVRRTTAEPGILSKLGYPSDVAFDAATGSLFVADPLQQYQWSRVLEYEPRPDLCGGADFCTGMPAARALFNGELDWASALDGVDDAIQVADSPELRIGDSFALELWVKLTTTAQTDAYLLNRDDRYGIAFGIAPDTVELIAAGFSGPCDPAPLSAITVGDTEWHHIVYSYDATSDTWSGYRDGSEQFSTTCDFALATDAASLTIGAADPSSGFVAARIDEVAIYDDALSAAAVQAHFDAGAEYSNTVLADAPVAYWRLGEETGATTATDEIGNNHGSYGGGAATHAQGALQKLSCNFAFGGLAPSELELDPIEHALWVQSSCFYTEMFDLDQAVPTSRFATRVPQASGMGLDEEGSLYVAGRWENVYRYHRSILGLDQTAKDQQRELVFSGQAETTADAFRFGSGVTLFGDQLIVADWHRILIWNQFDPTAATNGEPAEEVYGEPDLVSQNFDEAFSYPQVAAGKLWLNRTLAGHDHEILAFDAPMHAGAPVAVQIPLRKPGFAGQPVADDPESRRICVHNADQIDFAVTADGDEVWVADRSGSRVFRIANVLGARDPQEDPFVDVILGQKATGCDGGGSCVTCDPCNLDLCPGGALPGVVAMCNQGQSTPTASSLCWTYDLTVDASGNLWIADNGGEAGTNRRILQFDASSFPTAAAPAPVFGLEATRVFGTGGDFEIAGPTQAGFGDVQISPFKPAFHSGGPMLIGNNPYSSQRFPIVYLDPLAEALPQLILGDFTSYPRGSHFFDQDGNLYFADSNWSRVLIYLDPLAGFVAPAATPTPNGTATPTRTNTPPPTTPPTATNTPTPTAIDHAYPAEVVADAPVGYWRLGEPSGTLARDAVGDNDGTYVGGPVLGEPGIPFGDPDTAVQFDTGGDQVSVADAPELRLTDSFAIELWVKLTTTNQTSKYLVDRANLFAVIYGYLGGHVEIFAPGASGPCNPRPASAIAIPDTEWHHLVYSYDDATDTWSGYRDGAEVFSVTCEFALSTNPAGLSFGSAGGPGQVAATLDEIALYDHALSAERVAAHYRTATCGNGTVEGVEDCDDGADNGTGKSCCTATCSFKPNGNASCDGNYCTRPDNCSSGVCTPGTCADGGPCTACGGTCADTGDACVCL